MCDRFGADGRSLLHVAAVLPVTSDCRPAITTALSVTQLVTIV